MRRTVKLLDFVVLGAGKSGTTTLFHYLRYHPQIYLPPEKEVPFFSDDKWLARGWEDFVQDFFSGASNEVLWGKVTPQYMGDPQIPERIFRSMPNMQLIALLRNPVDRAFSYYRMMVRLKKEHRTFEEVAEKQLKEEVLVKTRMLPLTDDTMTETYFVRGEYGRILKGFLQYFSREQLLVLFMDDLEHRPQWVLDSISVFLGLSSGFSPSNLGKRYYVGGERQRFPWLIPVTSHIFPVKWLWKTLSIQRRRAIFFWYKTQINVARQSSTPLSPMLRRNLVKFYQSDLLELETLIGHKSPWPEFYSV